MWRSRSRARAEWGGVHEDWDASLVVTPAKNLWPCFGCQTGGGPNDWVMKTRAVSFPHAGVLALVHAGKKYDRPVALEMLLNR